MSRDINWVVALIITMSVLIPFALFLGYAMMGFTKELFKDDEF